MCVQQNDGGKFLQLVNGDGCSDYNKKNEKMKKMKPHPLPGDVALGLGCCHDTHIISLVHWCASLFIDPQPQPSGTRFLSLTKCPPVGIVHALKANCLAYPTSLPALASVFHAQRSSGTQYRSSAAVTLRPLRILALYTD